METTTVLGVEVPGPFCGDSEICHIFTLNYALAAIGESHRCNGYLLKNPIDLAQKLNGYNASDMQPGNIATFWDRNFLQHSMIVLDDQNWTGSNNINSFGIPGYRKEIFMMAHGIFYDRFTQELKVDKNIYQIRFYTPGEFARYVLEN